MTTESNVAIGVDSTATGAHNVRTVTVYPNAPASTDHGEEQQVVTIAGADGALLGVENGAIPVFSGEIAKLLKAIIRRLDMLNAMVGPRQYSPPDDHR